jgi:hypothetical protein
MGKATKRHNGYASLRAVIEAACADHDYSLGDLTVLSVQIDPYRMDTEAGHRNGSWLAGHFNHLIAANKKIHWRGLHYALVSSKKKAIKPDGEPYRNNDDNWNWLVSTAGKAARWLGYIPFDRISDNRNAEPFIHHQASLEIETFVGVGVDVTIPDADDLEPIPIVHNFVPRQAFHFCIFGEKASLEDVVLPIARAREADLYLPTGEISDTLLHQIAKDASEDGRPMVMFTLADCDPAGHQMSVSIGRKLQAFKDLLFHNLKFEIVPVALTVEQVGELGLPSTPLKETEKRADRWREAFGVEQTEIDALATLQPNTLREIINGAFDSYYDSTLDDRVAEAKNEWIEAAQEAINEQVDSDMLEEIKREASEKLAELREAIDSINERMNLAADRFTLPEPELPEPKIDEDASRQALVSVGDDWVEATRALIARKQYGVQS